jgi:hypothetical protein
MLNEISCSLPETSRSKRTSFGCADATPPVPH